MALTPVEIEKAKQLKNQGYTAGEIQEYIGAQRAGRPSLVMKEVEQRNKVNQTAAKNGLTWQEVVAAPANFLAKDAVDVFGSGLARRGIGTDTEANIVKEYVDEPTARQYAGAALQTAGLAADVGITVGSLGAAAPMTLGRNVALGAGLGYVYDVGEDLIAQESMVDTLIPGFGTAVGGAAPLVFAGLGAGARAMRPSQEGAEMVADDVARATAPVVRQTVGQATETTAKKIGSSIEETGRNIFNRFSRAGRHLQEEAQDRAARNILRQNATPAVNLALDEGIDTNTILRISTADDTTKGAYRAVVEAAESSDPRNAELVAGEYARDMYRIAQDKQRTIGTQLGEARRALGNDIIDDRIYNPTIRTFKQNMSANGIKLNPEGTVEFNTVKFTDEQQKVIENIWKRLSKFDTITPTEIDEVMQYLSRLEYQTNVADKIDNVYVDVLDQKTGQMRQDNLFRHIRNTYDSMLEQVDTTGQIGDLRRQYSTVKSVTGEIESNWFRGLDLSKATDEDLADRASLALRRLDSRAQSRTTYGQMYRALEKYARGNGYTGADAADVSNFYLKEVQPVYAKTVPEASFRGDIIGGIRSAVSNVLDMGQATGKDKQRALRGLLDMEDTIPTSLREATQSEMRSVDSTLNRIEGRLNESSLNGTNLDQNKQGGFARLFGKGDARTATLKDSIKEIETQMKRFDDRGVSPNSPAYKRLYEARDKLYEELSIS